MIGKIAFLAVALMLLTATVAGAAPNRTAELDNNPSPSDIVLTEADVRLYNSSSVWSGSINDQDTVDRGPSSF